jgi:hypothetical protein
MTAPVDDPRSSAEELRAHRQTFHAFNRLVLFAALIVAFVAAG